MDRPNGRSVAIFSNTFWSIYNFRRSLIQSLMQEGFRVIAISAFDEYKSKLEELGCQTVVIKNFDAKSTGVFKEIRLIAEVIKTLKNIDSKYIFTFTIKPNLYSALTHYLTSKKVIITVNGLGNVFSGGKLVRAVSLRLFRMAFKRGYRIVFQNRDDHAFFKSKMKIDDSKVIFVRGSGVNINDFKFSDKILPPGPELVFLLACRLLKEKGVYEYIEVARRVKAKYSNAQFWLLGMEAKNPSSIHIKDLQKFSEEGIIELLSKTDDVNSLLEKADVLVLPSYYNEGVPRILLEGLSKGIPIITTDSVGCKETVIDNLNGYLIEPRSVDALETAIKKMIMLPVEERNRMRFESRKLAESEFNESRVIDSYISLIK